MTARTAPPPLVATVALAAEEVDEQVLVEILEPLAEALSGRHASPAITLLPTPHLILELTLDGADVLEGLEQLQPLLSDVQDALTALLGPGRTLPVVSVTAQIQQRREAQLAELESARDLVGVAEIAEMRGVVVQSAHRTSNLEAFPEPFADLASGRAWLRRDVQEFFARRDAKVKTPAASAKPAGSTPSLEQRTAIAALLRDVLSRGEDLPAALASEVERPHALQGATLLSAIQSLGGSSKVAGLLGVTPRTVQRWAKAAELAAAAPTPAAAS